MLVAREGAARRLGVYGVLNARTSLLQLVHSLGRRVVEYAASNGFSEVVELPLDIALLSLQAVEIARVCVVLGIVCRRVDCEACREL